MTQSCQSDPAAPVIDAECAGPGSGGPRVVCVRCPLKDRLYCGVLSRPSLADQSRCDCPYVRERELIERIARSDPDGTPRAYTVILYNAARRARGRVYLAHAQDLFDLEPPAVRAIIDAMVEDGYLTPMTHEGAWGPVFYYIPTERGRRALWGLPGERVREVSREAYT